jgi:hypothetical protein
MGPEEKTAVAVSAVKPCVAAASIRRDRADAG